MKRLLATFFAMTEMLQATVFILVGFLMALMWIGRWGTRLLIVVTFAQSSALFEYTHDAWLQSYQHWRRKVR